MISLKFALEDKLFQREWSNVVDAGTHLIEHLIIFLSRFIYYLFIFQVALFIILKQNLCLTAS